MKVFSEEALAALERGDAIVTGSVAISSDPPLRVWGGHGTLTIGDDDYVGLGARDLAQASTGALGVAAQNVTLTLSGIDPVVLDGLDASEVHRAPTVIRRLIFANDGKTYLGGHVYDRGRIDQVKAVETIGGEAALQAVVEGSARGLGRRGGRMRTDADQRLVKAEDGHFRNVSFAAEKVLYWGGKRPARAGGAVGGGNGATLGGAGMAWLERIQ